MKNTFTFIVKEEILSLEFDNKLWKPLLIGFLKNNVTLLVDNKGEKWEITSQIPKLLRFIYKGLLTITTIKKEFLQSKTINPNGIRTYKMIFSQNLNIINDELKILTSEIDVEDNIDQERAFIAGLFLSCGSVNSPSSKTYHLEFRLRNEELSKYLFSLLLKFGFKPKKIVRFEKVMVYLKKSENISDLLKLMNANDSMFEFEDERINKDFSNQLHRLNNLDISNLRKTVSASSEVIGYINFIKKRDKIFENLSFKEKYFCEIRIKHPELSLEDMSEYFNEELNIKISKSSLNHYSRKMKRIYNNYSGEKDAK